MLLLHSLEVENFRILRQVHLQFGRGLNILFGPNDLGKSSLAEALRAALLLPVASTASEAFVPWGTDQVPRVVVVVETGPTKWRISKEFGKGSRGKALLERCGERQQAWGEVNLSARDPIRRSLAERAVARYGLLLHELTIGSRGNAAPE